MTSRPAEGKAHSLEPRIASRNTTRISPWVDLIARSADWGRAAGRRPPAAGAQWFVNTVRPLNATPGFVETEEPSGGRFGARAGHAREVARFSVGGDFGLQSHIGLITLALLSPSLAAILPAQLVIPSG